MYHGVITFIYLLVEIKDYDIKRKTSLNNESTSILYESSEAEGVKVPEAGYVVSLYTTTERPLKYDNVPYTSRTIATE